MKRTTMLMLGLSAGLLSSGAARAAHLYPWPAEPTVADPRGDAISPGGGTQDILGVWFATDLNFHYFRLDLAAAPVSTAAGGAEIYGVYIDSHPRDSGGSNASFDYIPNPLTQISHIVDYHLSDTGGWEYIHYHIWSPYAGPFSFFTPNASQASENGGTTLEWKFDKSELGDAFTFWGASITQGMPSTTHDITDGYVVPEPGASMLMIAAMGTAIVATRRRRR